MIIYYEQVRSLTISPELCEEYLSLCEQFADYKNKSTAKATLGVNVEAHHILPKSFKMGGEKDKANITYLPLVEHRYAHKLLKDMFGGKFRRDMAFAYSRIIHRHGAKDTIPIEEYAAIRSEVGKMISEQNSAREYDDAYRQLMSEVKSGTRWINDGETERMISPDELLQKGWVEGRLSCANKGRIWINNGTVNKMVPGDKPIPIGWILGMFKTNKNK